MYAFVDEFKKDWVLNNSELAVRDEGYASSDASILFAIGVAIYFLDHVDELVTVVHFYKAEEVAEEANNRVETGIDCIFVLLACCFHPIHLPVLT